MRIPGSDSDEALRKIERAFGLDAAGVTKIVREFRREMKKGLEGRGGSLKMIPAYVARPTGREKGVFLALDLGGTNFRVLEVRLFGRGRPAPIRSMKFTLKPKDINGTGEDLFGFIASSIETFLTKHPAPGNRRIPLGFTFSFPVRQTGVASGTLICWTKGFHASGVVGRDIVDYLRRALRVRDAGRIDVAALANDTVGTLVAHSYVDRACDVGVILGTGTNACYPARTEAIKKWRRSRLSSAAGDVPDETIVNIEWGNFNRLPRTAYDRALDRRSGNPGKQILEKMVSGMYLGEISRLILIDLARQGALDACFRKHLAVPGAITTADMSVIEADRAPRYGRTARILRASGIARSSVDERACVRRVCQAVSRRAARIAAAGIMAVVASMDARVSRRHTVAIDGSVYEKHPTFSRAMKEAFREALGRPKASRIRLALAKDGSGKGAAIIAAVACQR